MKPSLDTITIIGKDGKPEERLILRGVIDPNTVEGSVLPDIELGMRGSRYQCRNAGTPDETYHLQDDVFVIDGAQRLNAIRQIMSNNPLRLPRIGALIHVDTDFDWERERFRILNQERARLSPNILLRNARVDHPGVELIYNLSTQDTAFVLCGKITWEQRQRKSEFIPAMRLCRVAIFLHSRFTPGGRNDDTRAILPSLDKRRDLVGPNIMRENIRTFFNIVDECWNIRHIVYRDQQPQIKSTFLEVLADFFTDHDEFWIDNRLTVNARCRKKLQKFALTDPEVSRLCGSAGAARNILYQLLLEHFNSGKRTGRLVSKENGINLLEEEAS